MYKKSVMHVQSCCFANQTYCFFAVLVLFCRRRQFVTLPLTNVSPVTIPEFRILFPSRFYCGKCSAPQVHNIIIHVFVRLKAWALCYIRAIYTRKNKTRLT